MWKKAITIALLFPFPAYANCHKYREWNYPFPQSCNNRMVAMYVPKIVLKKEPPLSPVIIPKKQEDNLNPKLNILLGSVSFIPDIPTSVLFQIIAPDTQRKNALEKLKDRLH